ncbi:MAG: L,D-transpeptidase [Synechococcales cyanobacterium T60_A2020_003]|nr:L,D-transpeptidase [Synechococcales cyanobacterium T60_A2020_003]
MGSNIWTCPPWGLKLSTPIAAVCFAFISSSAGWATPTVESVAATSTTTTLGTVATIEPPPLPPLGGAEEFLPVPSPVIQLVIRLGDRRVYVYEGETLKDSFPIAIGRSGWETPTGTHEVIQMIQNPAWENPFTGDVIPGGDIENPLGQRWIGFWTDGTNFVGFHGTPNEESVGNAASHGCIRMYNRDVVKLFEMVEMGTQVTVVP